MDLSDWTIGIDLGDRKSMCCAIDGLTGEIREGSFPTSEEGLRAYLEDFEPCVVVFEVGGHSRWVERVVEAAGFEARVADPRRLKLVTQSTSKTDRNDARRLAQLSMAGLGLLNLVEHRDDVQQADLAVAKARDALVGVRTQLVNMVRGSVKSFGQRMPSCSAQSFHKHRSALPVALDPALGPVMEQIGSLTLQIRAYDRLIEQLCEQRYPETARLHQVRGVGPLTAFVFVLSLGRHERFRRSRSAAAYLGLCPRQHESGSLKRDLGITKAGDGFTRRLLVHAAHYLLGPFGEDCDLRRFGEALQRRGGKAAKKRAVVAVARKLAVLLHRLWADGADYQPLRGAESVA